jgi:predicted negative regulator of RcsB-dependent stress response
LKAVDLLSEDENWEELKVRLRSYAPAILSGLVIGAAIWYGWTWWGRHQEEKALDASARYEALLDTYESGDEAKGNTLLEQLKREHPESIYVAAGQLAAAKVMVSKAELDAAASALAAVAEGKEPRFSRIARLRLARLQIEQAKYDDALATLAKDPDPGAYAGAYAHVRGDALLRKGDTAGALREYRAARDALAKNAADGASEVTALLDLKIDDLQESP